MKIFFEEEGHRYWSVPDRSWISVTKAIERFTKSFNAKEGALSACSNPNSKWYGMEPQEVVQIWEQENKRSIDIGHWFHALQEKKTIKRNIVDYKGFKIKVYPSKYENYKKICSTSILIPGIYPELIVYNEKIGIIGQSDLVFVYGDAVDIIDYKTNKHLNFESYGAAYGNIQTMLEPIDNIMDCNYWHYVLQLSTYMYLILKKNPNLKAGKMYIIHIEFEIESYDKYGFPILKKSTKGYIIKQQIKYEIPYLEQDVIKMLKIIYKENNII